MPMSSSPPSSSRPFAEEEEEEEEEEEDEAPLPSMRFRSIGRKEKDNEDDVEVVAVSS